MSESHREHEVAATVSIHSERDPEPGSTTPSDGGEVDADGEQWRVPENAEPTDDGEDELPDISDVLGPEPDAETTVDVDHEGAGTSASDDGSRAAPLSGTPPLPDPSDAADAAHAGPASDSGSSDAPSSTTSTDDRAEGPESHVADGAERPESHVADGAVPGDVATVAEAIGEADAGENEGEGEGAEPAVSAGHPPPPKPENLIRLDPPTVQAPPDPDAAPGTAEPDGSTPAAAAAVDGATDPSVSVETLARVTDEVPASIPGVDNDDIEALLEQPTSGLTGGPGPAATDGTSPHEPTGGSGGPRSDPDGGQTGGSVTEPATASAGPAADEGRVVDEGVFARLDSDATALARLDGDATQIAGLDGDATQVMATSIAQGVPIIRPPLDPTQVMPAVTDAEVAGREPSIAAPGAGDPARTATVPGMAPTGEVPALAECGEPSAAVAAATARVDPSVMVGAPRRSASGPLLMATAMVGAVIVILLTAWAIDSIRTSDRVMRGTVLGTTPIGGLTEAELADVIDARNNDLAETAVVLQVGDTTLSSDPVSLGARLDRETITDEALDARRGGALPLRPIRWLGSFLSDEVLQPTYTVDADTTAIAAEELIATSLTPAEEPQLVLQDGELVVTEGVDGVRFDSQEIVTSLPGVLEQAAPYELSLVPQVAAPQFTTDEIRTVAAEASTMTADEVTIRVLDQTADLPRSTLRSWVELEVVDDQPNWRIDTNLALEDLKPLFPTLGSEDQQARFNIVDDTPIIIPASETVICCTEESIGRIRERLVEEPPPPAADDTDDDDDDGEEPKRIITIQPTVVGSDEGVAELEALGIVEEVSTFTTNHACCQNRVVNIQRFADLMRGAIIRPGEDFSLNEYVGQRTTAKGFVADGAIINGVLEPQVGGGISQFATTFFNASFYAGLDFNTYQSHSLYISRYPRGREATISWRRPDLSVRNTTPYGILVWPTYSSTSITVTFYSTQHIDVEDLPLLRSSRGQCSVYTTPRVRTYPDGRVEEDSVFALYRPGEGLDCNGNSTVPEEDEEPAGPSVPQPTPAPTPDPDPVVTTPPVTTPPGEQLPSSTTPG